MADTQRAAWYRWKERVPDNFNNRSAPGVSNGIKQLAVWAYDYGASTTNLLVVFEADGQTAADSTAIARLSSAIGNPTWETRALNATTDNRDTVIAKPMRGTWVQKCFRVASYDSAAELSYWVNNVRRGGLQDSITNFTIGGFTADTANVMKYGYVIGNHNSAAENTTQLYIDDFEVFIDTITPAGCGR
jgi:hypothetical protein